jgi:hypothetical protein
MDLNFYKNEFATPEIDLDEMRKYFVGNTQALFEDIEENIDGCDVTDETLGEWAKRLVSAINESDEIGEELDGIVTSILKKESACNTRSRNGYKVVHNKRMLARWHNLRIFVCEAFPPFLPKAENLSKEVLGYCEEIGLIQPQRESQAKAAFRLKYGEYIEDMDAFFYSVGTIKARQLKKLYDTKIKGSGTLGKTFLNDFLEIAPERKDGENRITYDNFKAFREDTK